MYSQHLFFADREKIQHLFPDLFAHHAQKQWNDWILDRKDRMQKLVNSNSLMTNNDDLDKSMAWMTLLSIDFVLI